MEDDVVTQGSMLPICILWKNGKKQTLNTHPNDINSLSELRVYENKSIDHLLWDIGETTKEDIVDQTFSSTKQQIGVL